jgi:Fe-S cluster assembly protein SufB
VKPAEVRDARSWEEIPEEIRKTYERLGIPEAERKVLAGVGAQYDSEMVYHRVREELERQGVIFVAIEEGMKKYEDLFREYFAKVVPPEDNKFAALNSAAWSGGSFVYVPPGVKVELPLQPTSGSTPPSSASLSAPSSSWTRGPRCTTLRGAPPPCTPRKASTPGSLRSW